MKKLALALLAFAFSAVWGASTALAALAITTTSLPNGSVGTAYSQTLAASGGTKPYTWSLTGGGAAGGAKAEQCGGDFRHAHGYRHGNLHRDGDGLDYAHGADGEPVTEYYDRWAERGEVDHHHHHATRRFA
jgi:hypothetical protein